MNRPAAILLTVLTLLAPLASASDDIRGIALAELGGRFRRQPASRSATTLPADTPFQRVRDLGANWVAIDDYANMRSVDDPHVYFGWGRGGSRDTARFLSRSRQAVADAHAIGLKVLIKPHIWSQDYWGERKWNGDIGTGFKTDADWDSWFNDYTDYILAQARMAQDTGADALCVGVEYQGTSQQEARWRKLVADVRQVYHGPLTYAATFLEWKNIKWWDCLDVIGIDAYFPIAQSPSAPDSEIRAGWEKVFAEIEPVAARWHKGVCFLELGYTTWNLTGKEPWSYTRDPADPAYQARLYKVALEEIKSRPWLKGVFLWKWMASDHDGWGRRDDNGFSREPFAIQDKPLVLDALRSQWLDASRKSAEASEAK